MVNLLSGPVLSVNREEGNGEEEDRMEMSNSHHWFERRNKREFLLLPHIKSFPNKQAAKVVSTSSSPFKKHQIFFHKI